jgi:uncharacterized protein YjbI with pentapeptide repeats
MANEEHLALLKQGVEAWNYWRSNNQQILADLSRADLRGLELIGIDLKGTNLTMASLNEANLSSADLSRANLSGANLRMANFSTVNLSSADLRGAYLSLANLSKAILSMANLSEANLKMANLSEANLSMANFNGTNLTGANLEKTIALDTNFHKAIFTGSCLEDWQINVDTNLDGAICDYVYFRHNQQERLPQQGNFAPGEFTQLFQPSLDIAEESFPVETNLVAVTRIEEDQVSFSGKTNVVEVFPIEDYKVSVSVETNVVETSLIEKNINNYTSSEPNLAEITSEIRQLLEQLAQVYPTHTPLEKLLAVTASLRIIETNPLLKTRIMDALKLSGTEVFQQLVNHPLSKILLPALED